MTPYDREEQDILDAFERGEWTPVSREDAARYAASAKEMLRKDARVNIRLSSRDLDRLKRRALVEGIPYQTLMASVLHKYVSGRLVERE